MFMVNCLAGSPSTAAILDHPPLRHNSPPHRNVGAEGPTFSRTPGHHPGETDHIHRATDLKQKGIAYLDVGTSGGVWGSEARGYCLMIGGDEVAVAGVSNRSSPPWPPASTPAPHARPGKVRRHRAEQGYLHCGPSGAGHFVKMVHNGRSSGVVP